MTLLPTYVPVSLERVELARLDEEPDAADVSLGAGQVEGRPVIVVGSMHVRVRVPEPDGEGIKSNAI